MQCVNYKRVFVIRLQYLFVNIIWILRTVNASQVFIIGSLRILSCYTSIQHE